MYTLAKKIIINYRSSYKNYFPLIIFLIALVIRLPLLHTPYWGDPDVTDYLNIAENINNSNGFTTNIKWHFFSTAPVTTSAFSTRPFLTSIIFAAFMKFSNDGYFLQMIVLLIGAVNCFLFYFLARHFFSERISFLAALLITTNPNILITNRLLLSEPFFIFFILLVLIIFYKFTDNKIKYIFLGILAGFAYLTRTEGILLLFALTPFLLNRPKYLLILFGSFFLTLFPYLYGNYYFNHNPFYSYNIHHFQVKHFSEAYWSGFQKQFPSPLQFIAGNISWIINAIFNKVYGNLLYLLDFAFFGPLLFLLFILSIKKMKIFFPIILFGFFVFVNYSVIWSAYSNPERHLIIVYMCLILPSFTLLTINQKLKYITLLFITVTLFAYTAFDIHRILWIRNTEQPIGRQLYKLKEPVYSWIINNTKKNDIIASWGPHGIYFYTKRPSIILPDNLDKSGYYKTFVKQYGVKYFVIEKSQYTNVFNQKAKLTFEKNGIWIYRTIKNE